MARLPEMVKSYDEAGGTVEFVCGCQLELGEPRGVECDLFDVCEDGCSVAQVILDEMRQRGTRIEYLEGTGVIQ